MNPITLTIEELRGKRDQLDHIIVQLEDYQRTFSTPVIPASPPFANPEPTPGPKISRKLGRPKGPRAASTPKAPKIREVAKRGSKSGSFRDQVRGWCAERSGSFTADDVARALKVDRKKAADCLAQLVITGSLDRGGRGVFVRLGDTAPVRRSEPVAPAPAASPGVLPPRASALHQALYEAAARQRGEFGRVDIEGEVASSLINAAPAGAVGAAIADLVEWGVFMRTQTPGSGHMAAYKLV